MLEKIKQNKKNIGIALLTILCILISFYIIYKLSSALLLVITGVFLLVIGSFIKDPEQLENKEAVDNVTQLSIFSEEVLEPIIIENEKPKKRKKKEEIIIVEKKERKKKNKEVLDIENTDSYKLDNVPIKKTKKA